MLNQNLQTTHNQFKMNGLHFNKPDILEMAYSFIKEGEAFEKQAGDFILDWFDHNSYIELQTSGTTGVPKTIRIEKQAMINSAKATGTFFKLSPSDKVLHCLSTKYIAGKMMFVRAFVLGLDLDFIAPNSDPLQKNNTLYDFAAMVPLQVQNSILGLKNIKKLIVGGAKMNPILENKLANLSSNIFETYGMTETITHIAAKKVGEKAFKILPNASQKNKFVFVDQFY